MQLIITVHVLALSAFPIVILVSCVAASVLHWLAFFFYYYFIFMEIFIYVLC